jgi:hypothetical protein
LLIRAHDPDVISPMPVGASIRSGGRRGSLTVAIFPSYSEMLRAEKSQLGRDLPDDAGVVRTRVVGRPIDVAGGVEAGAFEWERAIVAAGEVVEIGVDPSILGNAPARMEPNLESRTSQRGHTPLHQ